MTVGAGGPGLRSSATSDGSSEHAAAQGALGVLGGTFDPIHYGHLAAAEEVREALGLATVLFVPARQPPHKPDRAVSGVDDRVAMVEMAIRDNPAFRLSRIEVDRKGPSYSVDTVEELAREARERGEEPDIVFILSSEAVEGLPSWREPQRLARLCRLAVVTRPGHLLPERAWLDRELPGLADRFILLDGLAKCESGTDIRRRVRDGRSIRYHLPPQVASYIAEHRLYLRP